MNKNSESRTGTEFDAMADEDAAHFANFKFAVADYPLIAVFCLLFLVVLLQFLTRYVLNDSVAWTEEAARYLLIIIGFAGAIRCQIKGTHITLEFMDRYYGKQRDNVQLFALLMLLALMIVLSFTAQTLIERNSFSQMVSLPFPKYYLYAIVMGLIVTNTLVIAYQVYHQLIKIFKGN
ncbi:MAG: TRAP transporter small permease [Oceanospirillaceae bacterium]|nr:TRAP transporter small permease [Oceanospirillaceae bacterium]